MCDDCIKKVILNMSQEDTMLLQCLKKNKTKNAMLSIDKRKIIPEVKDMTEFKFNMSITRLELVGFIGRNATKRPNKFFITKVGEKALTLVSAMMKE